MLKRVCLSAVLCICLTSAWIAQAQQAMLKPPPVLVIGREVLKTGKAAIHEKWEAGWPRAFAKAKSPSHYLAASSLTGEARVLFLAGFDSMAAWEKDTEANAKNAALSAELNMLTEKDADYLQENRTAVFSYMPELSYQPEIPVAGARYFLIFSIEVKPGHGDHFVATRKIAREAHEKARLSDHYAVYRLVAGRSAGFFLIIVPMKSLAEMDQFPAMHNGKAYQDALGDDGRKKMDDFAAQGVQSNEPQIFAFSPKMSYASKEWIDADPDFWAPKPAPKAAKKAAPTQ